MPPTPRDSRTLARQQPDATLGNINGMGPILRSDGVAFRVWAPHAHKVALVGTFNAWNSSHHAMERESNGYWYAKVPEATEGHEYRYLLSTPAGNSGESTLTHGR